MKPKKNCQDQDLLFQKRLSDQLNPNNELYILSKLIDWKSFDNEFSKLFDQNVGARAKPVRLVVGILMLQHMYGISDEGMVYIWVENPYWQFFCGYDYLQWRFPLDPSSLCRWRKRLGEDGMEKILSCTIKTALDVGVVKACSLKNVIVDTTVMPKNIAYPTDNKLYFRSIKTLVKMAEDHNIQLRQTYKFLSRKASKRSSQYSHARQMRRAKKESKRLRTYLGRVMRDVERKISNNEFLTKVFEPILEITEKIFNQERNSKNKVYSIHEPSVECISKGKAHKKYEFGCKASIVLTHKDGLALSTQALHGNPYDGHTLKSVLKKAETLSGIRIDKVFVDRGYKGHGIDYKNVFISGRRRGVTSWMKKQMRRRQAIEPHIGHMKSDGKLGRNYLKGILGDKLNAVLCGIGHNLRLIIRKLCLCKELQPT